MVVCSYKPGAHPESVPLGIGSGWDVGSIRRATGHLRTVSSSSYYAPTAFGVFSRFQVRDFGLLALFFARHFNFLSVPARSDCCDCGSGRGEEPSGEKFHRPGSDPFNDAKFGENLNCWSMRPWSIGHRPTRLGLSARTSPSLNLIANANRRL